MCCDPFALGFFHSLRLPRECAERDRRESAAFLKDLDDVVCDAFSHPRINGAAHGRLSPQSRCRLDDVFDPDQIEQREFCAWLDLDEHVEIAIVACILARSGAEDRELRHALGSQRRSARLDLRDDLVPRHLENIDHSAASRSCPSWRLSFFTSSTAASAITVPGGKIASAPAARNTS